MAMSIDALKKRAADNATRESIARAIDSYYDAYREFRDTPGTKPATLAAAWRAYVERRAELARLLKDWGLRVEHGGGIYSTNKAGSRVFFEPFATAGGAA